MAGKPQLLLLVLTKLYRGDTHLRALVSLFSSTKRPTIELAEELLSRGEFEGGRAEMWYFFHLFASRRNAPLALLLIDQLYSKGKRPERVFEEFLDLIEDEAGDPCFPVSSRWASGAKSKAVVTL